MKKYIALLLVICMVSACLIGCSSDKSNDSGKSAHFTGKVIEVYQSGYLLKVTDVGTWDCKVGSLIAVTADVSGSAEFAVGDHLKVTFDTTEPMRSPSQIDKTLSIKKVKA